MLPRHARCAITTLVLLLAFSALASTHGPSEREGRRGLVFGVDGDRLLAFDGAMVAVRQQLGERTGLRLGLSFALDGRADETTTDRRADLTYPDTSFTQVSTNERSSDDDLVDLDLDLLLIRHDRRPHALRFCYGAGPMVGYRHFEDTEDAAEDVGSQRRTSSRHQSSTEWSCGLRVLVGAEWFLTESISVHAEYRAGVVYRTSDWEQTTVQVVEPADDQIPRQRTEESATAESDGWTVASHGARVGVSLFF